MTGFGFHRWFTARRRKPIAVGVAGWMFLSLVFAFWPCCQAMADEPPHTVSTGSDDHDHGNAPPASEDPCRTWLDTVDAALNTSPAILLSDFEPRIANVAYAVVRDFPSVAIATPGRHTYHPSPPNPLPLYLRVQHLLI